MDGFASSLDECELEDEQWFRGHLTDKVSWSLLLPKHAKYPYVNKQFLGALNVQLDVGGENLHISAPIGLPWESQPR